MKKNFAAMIAASAVLASTSLAFADEKMIVSQNLKARLTNYRLQLMICSL